MSQKVREDMLPKLRQSYAGRGRAGRSRMIDELCEQFGYNRKHAIKLLGAKVGWGGYPEVRKGRPSKYGAGVVEVLWCVWKVGEHPCGKRLVEMVESMRLESGMARLNLLFKLFLHLAQAPRRDIERLSKRPFDLSGMHVHQSAIERTIRHVLQHFQEPLPLNHILKLSGMSKATFSRQFKKHAGKPFTAFVNRVRLDAACRELVAGNNSIGEVAFANGFNSLSYFNRVFRSAMKCNPKDYRKRASH